MHLTSNWVTERSSQHLIHLVKLTNIQPRNNILKDQQQQKRKQKEKRKIKKYIYTDTNNLGGGGGGGEGGEALPYKPILDVPFSRVSFSAQIPDGMLF